MERKLKSTNISVRTISDIIFVAPERRSQVLNPNKSIKFPCPDYLGITIGLIKETAEIISESLKELFNQCITDSNFPN